MPATVTGPAEPVRSSAGRSMQSATDAPHPRLLSRDHTGDVIHASLAAMR